METENNFDNNITSDVQVEDICNDCLQSCDYKTCISTFDDDGNLINECYIEKNIDVLNKNNENKEKHFEKDSNAESDHIQKYLKMSLQERYDYCISQYKNIINKVDYQKLFKQNTKFRYIIDQNEFLFNYNYNDNNFKYKDFIFEEINDLIIYIRVHVLDDNSINWINPFYSQYIQYFDDNWKYINQLL